MFEIILNTLFAVAALYIFGVALVGIGVITMPRVPLFGTLGLGWRMYLPLVRWARRLGDGLLVAAAAVCLGWGLWQIHIPAWNIIAAWYAANGLVWAIVKVAWAIVTLGAFLLAFLYWDDAKALGGRVVEQGVAIARLYTEAERRADDIRLVLSQALVEILLSQRAEALDRAFNAELAARRAGLNPLIQMSALATAQALKADFWAVRDAVGRLGFEVKPSYTDYLPAQHAPAAATTPANGGTAGA